MANDKHSKSVFKVKPWKVIVGLALLIPIVLVQWLLHSTYLLRVVVNEIEVAVPELEITTLAGSLAEGVQASGYYRVAGDNYTFDNLQLHLGLQCLLRKKVCIEMLNVANIEINLYSKPKPDQQQPITLPTIELPIDIGIEKLTIARLQINSDDAEVYAATNVSAAAQVDGSKVNINKLALTDAYCVWQLDAAVELHDQYPLSASVDCQSVAELGQAHLDLSQSVSNLHAEGKINPQHPSLASGGEVQLQYDIQPLQSSLPMSLQLALQENTVVALQDQQLTLKSGTVAVTAENMQAEFTLSARADYSTWPGEHQFSTTGEANLKTLALERFAWQLPKGSVAVTGQLQFNDGLTWQGNIDWQKVDLAYWQQTVTGTLSGRLHSNVSYRQDKLTASADITAFDGTINDQAVSGDGTLVWQNQQLNLQQTKLTVGGSKVEVAGQVGTQAMDVRTVFSVPQLQYWLPTLAGDVSGQLHLQGAYTDPQINGRLNASKLQFQNLEAEDISATVNWQALASTDNRVDVAVDKLRQQDFIASLNINWHGSLGDHQWQVRGQGLEQHNDKALSLNCHGDWQPPAWSANCDSLDVGFQYFDQPESWRLTQPVALSANTDTQRLALSAFCFSSNDQSICNNQAVDIDANNPGTISLEAKNMSTQWVQPWLPAGVSIDGRWQAKVALVDPFQQQQLQANVEAHGIVLQWQQQSEQVPLTMQVQTLRADWQWQVPAQQHTLSWEFATVDNGRATGEATLKGSSIEGDFSLQQWQLAAFSRFLLTEPKDKIDGAVNADFSLAGNLDRPSINGRATLTKGAVRSSALPVPIENIEFDVAITDNVGKLNGEFTANKSPGNLGGEFAWSPEKWRADLSLTAKDLAYQPDPNIRVFVSPDVKLHLTPTEVVLTGDVRVPRATVEIEELPEQAASVSPDTVIVGNEKANETQIVRTDLQIILGDGVKFTGFGLETNITGNLHLRQNPGELMQGQGVLQLKEGRYKKYGQDLQIRNGDLVFVSDLENPQLRLEAIRDPLKTADEVIVGLRASGPAQQPTIALFSEPPLSQQEQMSYLISGVAPGVEKETDATALAAQTALTYALESSAGESFTQFAGRTLGISDLQVTADSNNQGTQIGLRGYVTPNLLVRYGVGVFDSVNSLTLQYRLRKNLYLEAVSGQSSALDLIWSFEKD